MIKLVERLLLKEEPSKTKYIFDIEKFRVRKGETIVEGVPPEGFEFHDVFLEGEKSRDPDLRGFIVWVKEE